MYLAITWGFFSNVRRGNETQCVSSAGAREPPESVVPREPNPCVPHDPHTAAEGERGARVPHASGKYQSSVVCEG